MKTCYVVICEYFHGTDKGNLKIVGVYLNEAAALASFRKDGYANCSFRRTYVEQSELEENENEPN